MLVTQELADTCRQLRESAQEIMVKGKYGDAFDIANIQLEQFQDTPLASIFQKIQHLTPHPLRLLYNRGLFFLLPEDTAVFPSMNKGIYEYYELERTLLSVKEGDYVVDVGSCVGFWAVSLAKAVGSTGKVLALEPEECNYYILEANCTLNNFSNIDTYKLLIGSTNTRSSTLRVNKDNCGDHSTWGDGETQFVEQATLDSLIPLNQRVDFIKIDVQGMECSVLRGARETIKRNPKVTLLIEYWPWGLSKTGSSREEFLDLLEELNLRAFGIHPNKVYHGLNGKGMKVDYSCGYKMYPMDRQKLLDAVNPETDFFLNLWCMK